MMFRPKSKLVEARQWTGRNTIEISHWLGYGHGGLTSAGTLRIDNRDGRVHANVGDWIVHEDTGFYPMEPIKFEAAYERA
jgi:hypothetical protein